MNTHAAGPNAMVRAIILAGLLGAMLGLASCAGGARGNVLTDHLSEPLNGATSASLDINAGTGHLAIDRLTGGEPLLAGGTLEYLEKQGLPTRSLVAFGGQVTLTLRGSGGSAGGPGFRWPWQACAGGAYQWQIHLNPYVQCDITAHSDGGNLKLDLAGMAVTRLSADTGGGNVDVVLPDSADDLSVTARTGAGDVTVDVGSALTGSNTVNASSGAGNVAVRVPDGVAVKVYATSGMGKVTVDSRLNRMDDGTYQSPDYDDAADRVEITVKSGAGNVSVDTR
ncbi:MAG: LiaF-related protein [Anaerolineae bacterium]|nr:LiaF-related protein [Anaerolineae bacterium]